MSIYNTLFLFSLTLFSLFCMIILGDCMKKMNQKGWGLSTMIGFMIGFVIFLIIITILAYRIGAI